MEVWSILENEIWKTTYRSIDGSPFFNVVQTISCVVASNKSIAFL